jgi:hypothetical protein
MAYYPKSQIKSNLYTNGGEYLLSSTREVYIGYYYEISTGQKYTGKTPQDGNNILLEPFISLEDSIVTTLQPNKLRYITELGTSYSNLRGVTSENAFSEIPSPSITLPTPQDYENGKMVRYFAKKTNELRYLEISKQTYTDLNSRSSNIAWDLYEPVQIQWIISGFEKQQVNDYNTIIVRDIERKKKWNGFSKFLKEDYTKYYKNLSA